MVAVWVDMSVKDTGSGIAEHEFVLGQWPELDQVGGNRAPVWPPIAKSLIDMHGGTFTLKSKLRIGTEVIVTLRRKRRHVGLGAVRRGSAAAAAEEPPSPHQPDDKRRALPTNPSSAGTGVVLVPSRESVDTTVQMHEAAAPAVQIPRGQGGEFALRAKIIGVTAPMVIDTGATSVVLTGETAKAIGLPLELLEYDVDVETAGDLRGGTATLDRLAVGKLVEKSIPALVVPRADEDQPLGMRFSPSAGKWARATRRC